MSLLIILILIALYLAYKLYKDYNHFKIIDIASHSRYDTKVTINKRRKKKNN